MAFPRHATGVSTSGIVCFKEDGPKGRAIFCLRGARQCPHHLGALPGFFFSGSRTHELRGIRFQG